MTTIKLLRQGPPHHTFAEAKEGDVFHLAIHGLEYSPELRANPPRVRLLENARIGHVSCELIDPWPDAPEYWPPWSAPGFVAVPVKATSSPASVPPLPVKPPAKPPPPPARKRAPKPAKAPAP